MKILKTMAKTAVTVYAFIIVMLLGLFALAYMAEHIAIH